VQPAPLIAYSFAVPETDRSGARSTRYVPRFSLPVAARAQSSLAFRLPGATSVAIRTLPPPRPGEGPGHP
jgi:hypothetical protein